MPDIWEIVQSVTEEENLGARVYLPQTHEKAYVGLLVREEESWRLALPSLAPRPYPRSSLERAGDGRL